MSRRKFASACLQIDSDSDSDSEIMATFKCPHWSSNGDEAASIPNGIEQPRVSASRAAFRPPPGRFSGGMPVTPMKPSTKSASSKTVSPGLEKKKRPKLIGPQTMVVINVSVEAGCEVESFYVHKNFITHYSPYFDAAFNGNFAEGQSQKLDLEDTEPHVFGTFVNWLYSQDIETAEGEVPEVSTLVNLWLLADKCLVPKLQNQVMHALDKSAADTALKSAVLSDEGRLDATLAAGIGIEGAATGAAATRARTYRDIFTAAGVPVPQEIMNATHARMMQHNAYIQHARILHGRNPITAPFNSKSSETPVARAPTPTPMRVKQNPALFHRVYENTTKGSKLRAYFVDICSKANVQDIEDDEADDYPHDMLIDIVNRMKCHDANKSKPVSEYYVSEDIPKRG